jgi:threonylcarbamoyladenosine tRNA methylthiotransferase MtaB
MSPDAFIAVVGCYAQLNPGKISSIPGVDLVLGTNEKFDIANYISDFVKRKVPEIHSCSLESSGDFYQSYSVGDRTRSFLKVQDGCDYGCSYCTIPAARGRSRNPAIATLIGEAERIAAEGVREIVLTGVNIGDFGKSTGNSFADLLRELVKVNGIERYRISSIEPNLITDEIIEMSGEGKILPHFHIPLQSGCNRILGLMRRRYTRQIFASRIMKIKERFPFAGIRADVIVGFPGETASDSEETYAFLREMPLTYLHVFTFSERPGTPAEKLSPKVTSAEKESRSKKLISLSEEKNHDFYNFNIGQETRVLFEHKRSEELITGLTSNYIRTVHPWQAKLAGQIRKVKMTGISSGKMNVEIIE